MDMKLTERFKERSPRPQITLPPGLSKGPEQVSEELKIIIKKHGNPDKSPELDSSIEQHLYDAYKKGKLDSVSSTYLREAPPFIFSGTENLLKDNQAFLRSFQKLALQKNIRKLWNSLIVTYFFYYDPDSPIFQFIANFLDENLREGRYKFPHKEPHNPLRTRIFNLENRPPTAVAEFVLNNHDSIIRAQTQIGLTGTLLGSDFMRCVYRAGAKIIKQSMIDANLNNLDRFIEWICQEDDTEQKIKGNAGEAALIGLLGPFREKPELNLNTEIVEKIKLLLLKSYDDPRFHEGNWPKITPVHEKDAYLSVVYQWLTTETLKLFFEIIGKQVKEKERAKCQWKERQDFWSSYLEQRNIRKAWVICPKSIANGPVREARETNGLKMHCGILTGSDRTQSVLLMQIGKLTIAEWSHSGGCRIWKQDNKNKPIFYKDEYLASQLRNEADFRQIHHVGKRNPWQRKIEDYIKKHAGI